MNSSVVTQATLICESVDIDMLKDSMDKLSFTSAFLDAFDKEATQIVIKYGSYITKLDEFISYTWPSDDDFELWKRNYVDIPDL